MPINLDRLDRTIMADISNRGRSVFNALEEWSACAGIEDDWDNAYKAIRNNEGFVGLKGVWVKPRQYIPNAVEGTGTHRRLPSMEARLQRVIFKAIQNSEKQVRHFDRDSYTSAGSKGSNKAFGTTDSPRKIVSQVARQMFDNQMVALERVTPGNTKWTKLKKKKRSDKPLIDYGNMKRATKPFLLHDGEVIDVN